MFDISFPELFICLVVALIVLGPEKLPKVARSVGRWTGQARAYMRNLSVELERETQVREIKQQMQEAKQAMQEASSSLNEGMKKLTDSANPAARPSSATTEPVAIQAAAAEPPKP